MKFILLFLLLLRLSTLSIYAQSERYFADRFIIGTSLTYIRHTHEYNYAFNEHTWNANIGITLGKRLFSGLQLLNIYTKEKRFNASDRHSIVGLFFQYDLIQLNDIRLFTDLSLNQGNYCTCSYMPYKKEGLHYLGAGIGLDYPLKFISGFSLDLSFKTYEILNRIEDKYSYTQYVIGLNYTIKVN